MNNSNPQSWLDFPVLSTFDPRTIIQACSFTDSAGTSHNGNFARSATWNKNVTWINPPMVPTQPTTPALTPTVVAVNPYDFASMETAAAWNGTHAMTLNSTTLPIAVQKLMFFKAGTSFANNAFFDWVGAATSTDISLSLRDNSVTSGDFMNGAAGTVPVFQFPTATYGGTGKQFSVTLLQPGRFSVCFRIIDNGGNYSMFEMEWIVLP